MQTKTICSVLGLFLCVAVASAAQLNWDPGASLSASGSGTGNWDTTAANKVWYNGSADVNWTQTSTTVATMGAIFGGTGGGTVTLDAGQIAVTNPAGAAISINSSGYVFTGPNAIFIPSNNILSVATGVSVTFNCPLAGSATIPAYELGAGSVMNIGGNIENITGNAQQLRLAGAADSAFNLTGANSIAIVYILAPVNQTSGSFTTSGNFFVGYPSLGYSAGILTINGSGTVNENGGIFIMGRSSGTGTVVLQNGGTLNVGISKVEPLDINYDGSASSSATVNMQGGSLNVGSSTVASQILLFATGSSGPGATAAMNQSGGGINAWGGIVIGNSGNGSGGSASLTQTGGTLYIGVTGITKGAAYAGPYTIALSGGTVGDLASPGWSSALPMTLGTANGNVTFSPNYAISLSGALTDAGLGGGLNMAGAGTLSLSGANNYKGNTFVSSGTLAVATKPSPVSSGPVTLDGTAGTPALTVNNTPGKSWSLGTLTFQNALSGTPALNFQFGSLPPSTTVAPLQITGDVDFTTAPTLTVGGAEIPVGTYPLITYTGSINNSGNLPASVTWTGSASAGTIFNSGQTIYLQVTASSVAPIYWGVDNGTWDTTTENWVSNSAPAFYADPDSVIFDNSAPAGTPNAVTLNVAVSPSSVTANNASNVNYIISGTGSVNGTGSLSVTGSGTLTLSNLNTYSGGTTINSGQLNINTGGNGGASAIGTGPLTINGGAIDNTSGSDVTLQPNIPENWNGDFTYLGSSNNFNTGAGGISLNQNVAVDVVASNFIVGGAIFDNFQGLQLFKTGNGALTLNGFNNYSGGLMLLAGIMNIGSPYFNGGGTFTINAPGGCAIDNTSGSPLAVAQGTYVWTTGFEFIGSAALDLGNGTVTGNTDPQPISVQVDASTLSTEGELNFGNVIVSKTGLGTWVMGGSTGNSLNLIVVAGEVEMSKTSSQSVNGTQGLTVDAGALAQDEGDFQMHSDTLNAPQAVKLQGGAWDLNGHQENVDILSINSGGTLENSAAGASTFNNISGHNDLLSGVCYFDVDQAGGVLNFKGSITGDGTETLIKIGSGTLNLASNNIYTGGTVISNGTLALPGVGSIAATAGINLATSGATLDLSSNTVSQTLVLQSGQYLTGFGAVNGTLSANPGSTVSPGSAATTGTLTVTGVGANTLGGATVMKLNKGLLTSDQLAVSGSLTYGGTLVLTNLSGTLANGDSFVLFNAGGGFSGSFASISPASPGPGLAWNTSSLPSNGTLSIMTATTLPSPAITSVRLSGSTLTLSATNGPARQQFVVLESTNVATPLNNWTPVYTNSFDESGDVNVSFNVTTLPQQFFTLSTK